MASMNIKTEKRNRMNSSKADKDNLKSTMAKYNLQFYLSIFIQL